MRYLIDTHVFLWWVEDSKRLKDSIKQLLADPQNSVYTSVVSGLEISIKCQSGKLRLKTTLEDCFAKSGFDVLDITLLHAFALKKLPLYHKDPFDRILISQAKEENLILITCDPKIKKYKLPLISA